MKRNKKNAVLAVLMVALLLVGAVGGTLAYLKTQTGTVENVFEPAEVPSEVEETFDGTTKSNVTIRNNGNVPAYIRAAVVVTWKDKDGNIYPKNPVKDTDYTISINEGTAADEWTKVTQEDGLVYYYYNSPVDAAERTENLISSCSVKTGAVIPAGYSLNVEILGQAIQAEGIPDVENAQDAWEEAAKNP